MKYIYLTIVLLATMGLAASDVAIVPQSAAGSKPQTTSLGTEAISIPQMLSYQGKLTDTTGIPVPNGNYSVAFRLYTAPSGGSPFWNETQSVTTKDGLFSVLLGAVTPIGLMPDAGTAYLAMAIDGGAELTPRLRLASAAYSYLSGRAADADLVQGKDTSAFAASGHNHDATYVNEDQTNSVTGAMLVNGTVQTADVADTAVTMVKIAQAGATTGQVVKWTGSAWAPGPDNTGGGSGVTNVYQDTGIVCVPNPITTSGNVKLDLSFGDSRYINEAQANSITSAMITDGTVTSADIRDTTVNTAELKDGAVTSAKILDGTVTSADIRDTTVSTADLKDASVTAPKLNQMGATSGQVLKWTGSAWAPRNDSIGGGTGDSVPGSFAVTNDLRVYGKGRIGNNTNAGTAAFAAGLGNSAIGNYSSITGGTVNSAGAYAFIGGGSENVANDSFSVVAGGFGNDVDAYGFIGAGQWNQTVAPYAVVGGGLGNIASRSQSAVLAGENNRASGVNAFVGAGVSDTASGSSAAVVAGYGNRAAGTYAFVGAGNQNKASGNSAAVVAGTSNRAEQSRAVVAGGWGNVAAGEHSFIGGGEANRASGYNAAVVAGENNLASGSYSVAAGRADSATAVYSAALSGYRNRALDSAAVVCGGDGNFARGRRSFAGGGRWNRADSLHAVVCGGDSNYARGQNSFIGGGYHNTASYASVVGGGNLNTASASQSVVGGGVRNTASGSYAIVGGGWHNIASGLNSVIPGGEYCTTSATNSFATGSESKALHYNSAVFNGQATSADNQTRVGVLSKASGTFTIDHPLDPHGKILNHYFIEGPEMRNIYDGETVLDASGRAVVHLPDYFAALNRNPRVQLTGVGTYQVYIAEEVTGNRFTVGGPAGTKVYWQVTGERQDVSAEATRRMMPVEQPKTGVLAGRMLDDDFLVGSMDQLEREGNARGIDFRSVAGRERYRQLQQRLREAGSQERR